MTRLRLVGDAFANALARLFAGRKESDMRDRLALAHAPDRGAYFAYPAGWVFPPRAGAGREAARLFKGNGHRVRAFASAPELLGATLDGPGCAVIDLDEAGAEGLETQSALAARRVALPVVFLTDRGDMPLGVRAMKCGAIDVLSWPFDDLTLQEAVARGVERHAQALREEGQSAEVRRRAATLTRREREVMALVVTGLPNKRVGAALDVTEKTVKAHRGSVMRKMRAGSLAELVRMADRLSSG
ncbi:MAG: response regulator transcription factor [Gemmataceae bacterium]